MKSKAIFASVLAVAALCHSAETGESGFKTLGVMLDVSRGRVLTVPFLKGRFERMSKMGYNAVMLYTEDTYRLEGVPKWGYMRGGYTLAEMKEIKVAADANRLELVPCIETLGHLEKYLRWPDADAVRCTGSTLLVGEPKTYELIDKMVAFWQEAVGGKRIHVGMDEAVGFWDGEYRKRNGQRPKFDVFLEHLQKVCEICERHGFSEVMIWSDMFYRMGSKKHDYYDIDATPSPELAAKIPKCVRLVYWDYYHSNKSFYEKMIDGHAALGSRPVLAGGIQTWNHFLEDRLMTLDTTKRFIEAGLSKGCDEMWLTMWGDDGGYAVPEAAEAGLFACAELAAGRTAAPTDENCARFRSVTGMDYRALAKLCEIANIPAISVQGTETAFFYDDPLYMANLRNTVVHWGEKAEKKLADWRKVLFDAASVADDARLPVAAAFARTMHKRLEFSLAILGAWKTKDSAQVKAAAKLLDEAVESMRLFTSLYRDNWNATSQPFGFELIQKRNAAALARLEEAKRRLDEYLTGRASTIPEFDEALTAFGRPAPRRTISW